MSKPLPLKASEVWKTFDGVTAVSGVSLELGEGETVALVGPSGCGKSSLLRMIAGLDGVDGGEIQLQGVLVDDGQSRVMPENRSVGIVFQEHALFGHLTVAQNVGFGLRTRSRSDCRARVAEMLALIELPEFSDRFPHELSGGERQRVALARALAPGPTVMLFDEPFASLDQNLRVQLREQVAQVLDSTNTPALFVTHDPREALALGDRIAVMRAGQIEQVGVPEEIYRQPSTMFVASFMDEANFLSITKDGSGWSTVLGAVEQSSEGDFVAMVRPSDVEFASDDSGDSKIQRCEYAGSHWLLQVRLRTGDEVVALAGPDSRPAVGDRGTLGLRPGARQVVVCQS